MTVGMRIRNRSNNALMVDISDYTAQMYYTNVLTISGNGSIGIAGINASDFCAFMIPCFAFGYPVDDQQNYLLRGNPAMMIRTYINGSSVSWIIPDVSFTPGTYQLLVVRYR